MEPVYIIGHKNPDTDSVCSAIALAELKQKLGENAIPARLGHLNGETQFILDKLGVSKPLYLTTAKSTIEELDCDDPCILPVGTTTLQAQLLSANYRVKTMYIVDKDDCFVGSTTIAEIAKLQLQDVEQKRDLLKNTPNDSIVEALKGHYLNKGTIEKSGEVEITTRRSIEKNLNGAIMIVNDHEDEMIKCMAKGCACIVICENFQPNSFIIDMAKAMGTTIISTEYNMMNVIHVIYRSIPVDAIMTPADKIVKFNKNEYVEDVEKVMLETRHTAYPIVSKENKIIGSLSRYHLLKKTPKQFILVDHNEKKQTIADIDQAEVVEIVDHHRIGDIETSKPIVFRNMTVGSTCTIVGMMFREHGIKMSDTTAKLVAYGIISDTMNFNSPTTTETDKLLASAIEVDYGFKFDDLAAELFAKTASIKGKDFKKLLYTDVKEYILSGHQICVSQTFTYDLKDVDEIADEFEAFMKEQNKIRNFPCHLMAFTNVEGKGSRYIVVGRFADQVKKAFDNPDAATYVSRKKQFVPTIAQALA
ncbi:MAG: putative manganese-dependent inorganic diphosphatase [Bacillota bacterium]|nr:putative manganese-dependent inorganic diphosphatase [Bacillota bacterium]